MLRNKFTHKLVKLGVAPGFGGPTPSASGACDCVLSVDTWVHNYVSPRPVIPPFGRNLPPVHTIAPLSGSPGPLTQPPSSRHQEGTG
ncbi:MAG: hypothetical protein [Cressdnaviricota sp.]|nr:MAG: hypothetical protein [Cressdnaviricota sp.]